MAGILARARAEFHARLRSIILLALIIGLAGGATLTALAGARRADSAVARFLNHVHPADGSVQADPRTYPEIARLPQVASTTQSARFLMARIDTQGRADPTLHLGEVALDNAAFTEPTVVSGRRARPDRADEVTINPSAAENEHLVAGSTIRLQGYGPEDAEALLKGASALPTGPVLDFRVVGIERFPVDLNVAEPTPGVDYFSQDSVFLTPAFYRAYVDRMAVAGGVFLGFRLKDGPGAMSGFEAETARVTGGQASVLPGSDDVQAAAKATRATHLEALALLLFAILASIVTLTMVAQAFARQVHLDASEYPVLQALGMTRRQLAAVAAIRGALVGVTGSALAVVAAMVLSPRMPIGLARQAEVDRGFSFDAPVIAVGALALVALPAGWAALVARAAVTADPHGRRGGYRPSRVAEALSRMGLPPSATLGARMALETGRGATAVPVRTMIAVGVTAVGVVAATLTFGVNLTRLAAHPRLQGWVWDAAVGNPHSADVAETAIPLLAANPTVDGFSSIAGAEGGVPARIDDHDLSLFGMDAVQGSVLPPYTAGRPPRAPDEIALGARTMAALHRHVGDRLTVSVGGLSRPLVITGRLVLTPRVVNDGISFGEGAVVTSEALRALGAEAPVSVFLVRFTPRIDRTAALQRLQGDFPGSVLGPSRPPDLENLRRVDHLPSVLAALFALVALLSVGHTLMSSVRRRRRDLAVLRALGFVRRQISAAVAWQATIVAIVSLAVGLPLGVAAGRWGWTLITDRLGLPPAPVVPGLVLLVLGLLSLAAANLVAMVPGLLAARTSPAAILHTQ